MYVYIYIYYRSRVGNILFGGHKLDLFVFLEIFSAYVGWYGEILCFNSTMKNSALWLTLALPSRILAKSR